MSNRRRGISLLEVLISVFIISIGLVGVLSLLPVGHHEALEGTLADRAALVGKYAVRDYRTRGMDTTHNGQRFPSEDDPNFSWSPTLTENNGSDRANLTINLYFLDEPVATYHKTIRVENSSLWRPP